MSRDPIFIGAYYDLPDGTVARLSGWDGSNRTVSYRRDDDLGTLTAPEEEVGAWTRRDDLADFPNSRDPVLPFAFDLNWDAKRRSDLPPLLADPETAEAVAKALGEHGIVLTDEENRQVEAIRDTARLSAF